MTVYEFSGAEDQDPKSLSCSSPRYDWNPSTAEKRTGQASWYNDSPSTPHWIGDATTAEGRAKEFDPTIGEVYTGFAFKVTAVTASPEEIMQVRTSTATYITSLQLYKDGTDIKLRAGGTLGTTVLSLDQWYWIEWRWKTDTDGTDGITQVYLDGNQEINITNLDFAAATMAHLRLVGTSSGTEIYIDDFYLGDEFLGDVKVALLRANADGTDTAWTGSYTDVDDIPLHDGTSTEISTSTNTNAETVGFQDSSTISDLGTIHAVSICAIVREGGAGGTHNLQLRVRDGATTDDKNALNIGVNSYTNRPFHTVMSAPPSGGSWTTTKLDALQGGVVHAQAQSRSELCTAIYCQVLYTPAAAAGPPPDRPLLRRNRLHNLLR